MSEKQNYIDSVDGFAHQSAVDIIEKLEKENKALEEIHGKTIDIVIDLYHRLEIMEDKEK